MELSCSKHESKNSAQKTAYGKKHLGLTDIKEGKAKKKKAKLPASRGKTLRMKLTQQKEELERLNTALHVLLEKRENDKAELEHSLMKNIQTELLPLTKRLKKMNTGKNSIDIINAIETKLRQIQPVSSDHLHTILSHTELLVANLIREGKASKTIADILNISKSTVDSHRDSIRYKTGLKNTGKNLKDIL